MNKQWSGVFAAAMIASAALVGAQGNPPQQNAPPPDIGAPAGIQKPAAPPAAQPKAANTVTISGCVEDTLASAAAGAPAAAGQSASTKTFYLNNAAMAGDAGSNRPAVGTSGLAATGYKLDGDTATISPHLNHQVRIVGTVQPPAAGGAAGAAATPTLKVDSLTMVSAKCEEKK